MGGGGGRAREDEHAAMVGGGRGEGVGFLGRRKRLGIGGGRGERRADVVSAVVLLFVEDIVEVQGGELVGPTCHPPSPPSPDD